jgi:hypothetical protein
MVGHDAADKGISMMNAVKETTKHMLDRGVKVFADRLNTRGYQEDIYRYLFIRDITRLGIEDRFYPVGAAANYSLMYLLTRCMLELKYEAILEFGAGQTSILLENLSRLSTVKPQITTVEQDEYWANQIASAIAHPVLHVPLKQTTIGGRTTRSYDVSQLKELPVFDLAVVDGPTSYGDGDPYSRMGSAEFLRTRLAEDFVVIFDDAERVGEMAAVNLFRQHLIGAGIGFYENTIIAAKRQDLFCTEKFRQAAYF